MKKTNITNIATMVALAIMVTSLGGCTSCAGQKVQPKETIATATEATVDEQSGKDFFDNHGGTTIDPSAEETKPTEVTETTAIGNDDQSEPEGNTNTGNTGNSNSGSSNSGSNNSGSGSSDNNTNNGNANPNAGITATSGTPVDSTEPAPSNAKPGHWEEVVVEPAWDEVVVDKEAWDETIKTAVGKKWTQNDTGEDMTGWSNKQLDDWCQSHNCPNHCDDYDSSKPGYCADNRSGTVIYETTTVHHEAETHIVHHDAVTEKVWVED